MSPTENEKHVCGSVHRGVHRLARRSYLVVHVVIRKKIGSNLDGGRLDDRDFRLKTLKPSTVGRVSV